MCLFGSTARLVQCTSDIKEQTGVRHMIQMFLKLAAELHDRISSKCFKSGDVTALPSFSAQFSMNVWYLLLAVCQFAHMIRNGEEKSLSLDQDYRVRVAAAEHV